MSLESVGFWTPGGASPDTTALSFRTGFTDFSWRTANPSNAVTSALATAQAEASFSFDVIGNVAGVAAGTDVARLLDPSNVRIVYFETITSNPAWTPKLNLGSSQVTLGPVGSVGIKDGLFAGRVMRLTLDVKIHASTGYVRIYQDGFLTHEYTGDTIGSTGRTLIKSFTAAAGVNGTLYYSLPMWGVGESCVGLIPTWLPPTGNGANTAWTGTFADVDETGPPDAAVINTTTAAQRESYTAAALPVTTGVVYAVCPTFYGAGDASRGIKTMFRIGGVNYDNTEIAPAADLTQKMRQEVIALSPATGVGWTASEISGAEYGVLST